MFLALKEIKKEKLRSGLIIAMIALIGYLIFILTGLALGLAHENTDAINSWHVQRITLNATANTDMRQSTLTSAQIADLTSKEAALNEVSVVAKASGRSSSPPSSSASAKGSLSTRTSSSPAAGVRRRPTRWWPIWRFSRAATSWAAP